MLPDRSILIGQKLVETAKIEKSKWDIFGDFQTLWLGLQLNKHRFFVVFGWNSFVQKLSNQRFNFTSKVALLIKYFGPSWLRQFCIWMLYQQRNRFYGRLLELQEECQNLRMTSDGVGATSFIPLPDANNRIVLHFFFTLYKKSYFCPKSRYWQNLTLFENCQKYLINIF